MISGRLQHLNDKPVCPCGKFVLYWMQQAQRVEFNHALAYAIERANELNQCVVVGFGLMEDYPEASERHFAFMLEGLAETSAALAEKRIKFVVKKGAPDAAMSGLARHASLVVCDRGYLRHQREWREEVARTVACQVTQIETDVVVPIEIASNKAEYAARTIRKKINTRRDEYIHTCAMPRPKKSSLLLDVKEDVDIRDWRLVLEQLSINRSVERVTRFPAGPRAAHQRLKTFVDKHLKGYADARNDPANPECSEMSPYLHFGQISPLEIALACQQARQASEADREAYLEELIVRRELAINFVYYTPNYDSYDCIPDWAKTTLGAHRNDARANVYTFKKLEKAQTHDPAWNAAMLEMLKTGYMHNYMRMYWGKKIIEWSATPQIAFETTIALNNKYFIDGRDPNSYCGVAWLFGVHDRAWQERPVFGKIRYMNAAGLQRKFDVARYIAWADAL